LRIEARAIGATVVLHSLSAPGEVLLERIQCRNRENPPIEPNALSQWIQLFQAPTLEELALFDQPLVADFDVD
jgi:hypothetical protein